MNITPRPPIAEPPVIAGERLRCLIMNAHRLLRPKYRGSPLWALVSDLTGYGSTTSCHICRSVGLEPVQMCDEVTLKEYISPKQV